MSMSVDLAGRRQRLKVAIRAVRKARDNARSSKQETVAIAALAAAWAAVLAVADLIPEIKALDGKLVHKPKSDANRKGDRLAQAVLTGSLDRDIDRKKNKLKQIESKIDRPNAWPPKFGDTKSTFDKASQQLKQKGKTPASLEAMFAELAKDGVDLANIGSSLAGAVGTVASKMRDAAINRFLTALLAKLNAIERKLPGITAEAKKTAR